MTNIMESLRGFLSWLKCSECLRYIYWGIKWQVAGNQPFKHPRNWQKSLKMGGWNTSFLFEMTYFQGYVIFRDCKSVAPLSTKLNLQQEN